MESHAGIHGNSIKNQHLWKKQKSANEISIFSSTFSSRWVFNVIVIYQIFGFLCILQKNFFDFWERKDCISDIVKLSITHESIMSDRNFDIFEVRLSFDFKGLSSWCLQVFLQILALSIIGVDDTSVVRKIPKTSTKVFGPLGLIFWVLRVNIMLPTGKPQEYRLIQVVNHLVNRGYNILITHSMQFWTSISKICLFLIYYFLFQSYHELALKPLILRPSRHIANLTLIVLWVPKTNTKVFGPVEFIFPAFGVIRLSKTGKTAKKPVNSRGLLSGETLLVCKI